MNEIDSVFQLRLIAHDGRFTDAQRRIFGSRFDQQWKFESSRFTSFFSSGDNEKAWRADAMEGQNFLGQWFVMSQQQTTRIATGVVLLHQFQITDDVMVVDTDAMKLFQQVEPDVRFELFGRAAQIT